jgi:hypothetical protein
MIVAGDIKSIWKLSLPEKWRQLVKVGSHWDIYWSQLVDSLNFTSSCRSHCDICGIKPDRTVNSGLNSTNSRNSTFLTKRKSLIIHLHTFPSLSCSFLWLAGWWLCCPCGCFLQLGEYSKSSHTLLDWSYCYDLEKNRRVGVPNRISRDAGKEPLKLIKLRLSWENQEQSDLYPRTVDRLGVWCVQLWANWFVNFFSRCSSFTELLL